MDSLVILAVLLGLVALNGVFVGAEFALIRVPRVSIERLAAQGHRTAARLASVLRSPRQQDRYIVTTQLGVTSASIGLGMYGEQTLAERLLVLFPDAGSMQPVLAHGLASGVAIALCTFLHVVLGEMVPKSLALARPRRFSLAITPVVLCMRATLLPIVASAEWVSNRILRAFGVQRQLGERGHGYTPEDLRAIVARSREGGSLGPDNAAVLDELFEFSALSAGEVMVPRVAVQGIEVGCEPEELARILLASQHSRYPIFEGDLDHVLGTAHVKELIRLLRTGRPVEAGIARELPFVPETSRLNKVLAIMREHRTHMAIVMDEHGGTAGLVTVEDLFEEVVDIPEAGEPVPQEARVDDSGRIEAAGTLRLEELGELLGIELEHEESDTVSGLVLMLLDRPAEPGDRVEWRGLRFVVTEVEGHGVGRCEVTRVQA